jgi:16S rRNA (uracil1498-N3)-methyltransferase
MRRFYFDSVPENNTACIRGDEARHIEKVLRLGPGDSLELFDAEGSVYRAVIESLHRGEVITRICERTSAALDTDVHITLCQAVVKSRKMDFIVEKCTELGVTTIQPFFASRSVPRWDENKARQRVQHWGRIALTQLQRSACEILSRFQAANALGVRARNIPAQPACRLPAPDRVDCRS